MPAHSDVESRLLRSHAPTEQPLISAFRWLIWIIFTAAALLYLGQNLITVFDSGPSHRELKLQSTSGSEVVESEVGVVATDDWRCSNIGVSALRSGGHAVDAAVASALCLGFAHPMSSGIGGGGFTVVWPVGSSTADSFDSRETAPMAASKESKDKELESWKNDIENKLGMLSSMQAEITKLKAKSYTDYGIAPEHWLNVKSNIVEGVILYIAKLGWLKHGLLNDPALKDLAIEKYEDIRNAIFADLSRQPDVSRLLSTPALVVPPFRSVECGFQPFQFFLSQGQPIEGTSVVTTQRQSDRDGGQPSGEKSFKL